VVSIADRQWAEKCRSSKFEEDKTQQALAGYFGIFLPEDHANLGEIQRLHWPDYKRYWIGIICLQESNSDFRYEALIQNAVLRICQCQDIEADVGIEEFVFAILHVSATEAPQAPVKEDSGFGTLQVNPATWHDWSTRDWEPQDDKDTVAWADVKGDDAKPCGNLHDNKDATSSAADRHSAQQGVRRWEESIEELEARMKAKRLKLEITMMEVEAAKKRSRSRGSSQGPYGRDSEASSSGGWSGKARDDWYGVWSWSGSGPQIHGIHMVSANGPLVSLLRSVMLMLWGFFRC
jgi:hypothetical protein